MDHSMAHLMEISTDPFEVQTIESEFQNSDKLQKLAVSEKLMHQKEKQLQRKYYKKISQAIKNFYHVVLFGPTDAKNKLYNMLAEDRNFGKIKIEIKETDKMTAKQQEAFLKEYFTAV